MSDCPHENFDAFVDVARIEESEGGPIGGFMAEIKVWCHDCGEQFAFHGDLPIGSLPCQPCLSSDRTELRAPLRPVSSDPSFGLGLTGFTMRQHQQSEGPHVN